ncbi:hypothetical protein EX30DRAFT_399378 [Ascodesmis nigricans]|uniref:Calcium-channel protein CCH1 n=1 Tax=Ascodesmis nigricans TaxID=341454 RepID=A0A4S2MPL8_9PEZI|nr:hypothetical protein EX30DRAFT_399378 [Ascodesmis nigricans]
MATGGRDNFEPIPLQDLSVQPNNSSDRPYVNTIRRSRSLLSPGNFGAEIGRRISARASRESYHELRERRPNRNRSNSAADIPDLTLPRYADDQDEEPTTMDLRAGVAAALGQETDGTGGSWLPPRNLNDPVSGFMSVSRKGDDDEDEGTPSDSLDLDESDDDTARLTNPANQQPMSGYASSSGNTPKARSRRTSHSSRYPPGSSLGDDLISAEEGMSRTMSGRTHGSRSRSGSANSKFTPSRSTSVSKRTLSPGASPVRRVSVALQNMSQRVVNLSNDPEAMEQTTRRRGSERESSKARRSTSIPPVSPIDIETSDESFVGGTSASTEKPTTPLSKASRHKKTSWHEKSNPLKGRSLNMFGPTNTLRIFICDVLIHPVTEPLLLILILIQTVLLAVDAAPSVYDDPRSKSWGSSPIDYSMLVLFCIYTVEIVARCIVSGFILNPRQPTDPMSRGRIRRKIIEKGQRLLSPFSAQKIERSRSPMKFDQMPSIIKSFTHINMMDSSPMQHTVQSQARARLARRAFLRHSFNRLDFLAVCSYWISLALTISGLEAERHLFVFRMMSCLRILRLLSITSGTSVILRSLKKAAPLLVHVAFLIGFFWLVFAVIGVQSFKGSFRRMCVWVDPAGIQANYTQDFQFCGGHLNAATGEAEPFVLTDGTPGTKAPKGYICPPNSFCVSDENPYGGTVSFDNIAQSLELVFVIMTSNTFSNLLYYTADSDYLVAALFFIAGIVVLAFWLANLLIAVITSSFQVIRDESQRSAFAAEAEESSVPGNKEEEGRVRRPSAIKRIYGMTYYLWLAVISAGIVAQGFRGADTSDETNRTLDKLEIIICCILFVEIIMRFLADYRSFHKHRRNWVDLALAVIALVISMPGVRRSSRAYDWMTIFSILRVYRVVWAIPVTRNLLAKVLGNVSGLSNLLLFVILLTFLCAIFAVQLVRGDIPAEFEGETLPITFHTMYNSFLGMYQIFSSEDWTAVLYITTQVQAPYGVGWISAMFFIGWFILGNFIILNMFIAVIQENFDVSEDQKRLYQVKTFLQNKSYAAPSQGIGISSIFQRKKKLAPEAHSKQAAFEMLTKQAVVESFLDEGEHINRGSLARAAPLVVQAAVANLKAREEKRSRFFQRWYRKLYDKWRKRDQNPFYNFSTRSAAELAPTAMAQEVVSEQERRKKAQREYLAKHPNYNVSLYLFKPTNPIRRLCQRLVQPGRGHMRYNGLPPYPPFSYTFSLIVYAAIMAMVILACITTPLYQKEYFQKHGQSRMNWFTLADTCFAGLFTIESAIKIIADGMIWTPNAYLRGSWGIIDCVVLITLWINVGASLRRQDEIARAVGAFKALRALRLLNISGTAQDTFHSVVILGGRKIISAAFVSLSLIIPFAIWGVNLFAGRMDQCNDGSGAVVNLTDCVHEYASSPFGWDVLAPRAVETPYFNFDDFGTSLFSLFQIVSQEGWTGAMYSAQAIVGKGLQPEPFASQFNSVFFLLFNLLGAVFVLTLFVSVFMRNYTEQTGVAFLTSDQRSWLELRKLLRQVRPSKRPNENPEVDWRSWCYRRATHKHGYWNRAITTFLVLHGILLLLEYYPSPQSLDTSRDWLFLALTITFMMNLGVRIAGLTWSNFLKSKWDLYALVSVTGTLLTTLLLLAGYSAPAFIQLQKLFLVSIVIMLIPRNNQLDQLFKTAAASLSSIGNLMATWFVLFLVYAIALTQTFGLTKIGPNGNGNMNFRTVPKALILLFRMTCGEAWNEIMSDYEVAEPSCVRGSNFFDSDCGSETYARALFVSWNILSMYIFVSMFISLIFESFSYVYQRSGDSSAVSREELRKFKQAWAKFDPAGTGYIPKDQFPRLLAKLSGVFAIRIYEEPFTVPNIVEEIRIDPSTKHGPGVVEGIDLDALNRRIAKIPVHEIRRKRHQFKLFFEECLVSADKDYGVSFESVLIILAHYKIINDNKSLKLEEYLRRRYRLQRVEEQVQRNCVTNFFLTLYWHRRFKNLQAGARTPASALPHIDITQVPQIFVDDASSIDTDDKSRKGNGTAENSDEPFTESKDTGTGSLSYTRSLDSVAESGVSSSASVSYNAGSNLLFSDFNPFAHDSGLRQRSGRRTPPDGDYQSSNISPSATPIMSPSSSPRLKAVSSSWYSGSAASQSGRRSSELPPLGAVDNLDPLEWREEIISFINEGDNRSFRSEPGSTTATGTATGSNAAGDSESKTTGGR